MQKPLNPVASTILISNLHCSSCTQSIQEALATLSPQPDDVNISIVSQSVTLRHDKIPRSVVESVLEAAGFDIVQALPSSSTESIPLPNASSSSTTLTSRQRAHLERCKYCQDTYKASAEKEICLTHTKEVRLIISIDGMTCAACSSSVTRALSEIKGVKDVSVDLMGKSAAVIAEEGLADDVVGAIEDCGFEANVIQTEDLNTLPGDSATRTVHLRIDGMFCQHCPKRAMDAIEALGAHIDKRIESMADPIVTVTYTPDSPHLTIRTLLQCLPPPLAAAVYHPPSLSDLSRVMNQKERRQLLYRLIVSVIVAIPTLIIGIVYMMLVKDGNNTKAYLMEPMWAGNVSRSQWALLFLATPVMFYCASVFHQKSLKEVYALWRKGSRASFTRRFFQFGSMSLLVSCGVSVAYFTSIALLILASQHEPDMHGMGDDSTYFDTTVFLTMFLLAGKYLEAYSKSRTADAVAALSKLRANKAILVEPASSKIESEQLTLLGDQSTKATMDIERGTSEDSMTTHVGTVVKEVLIEHIDVGDIIRVPQGASPPADGIVLSGYSSSFDESSLTGESRPVTKNALDKVFAGTINKGRMIEIKAEGVGSGTMLDNIIKVVREGQTHRAPIERIADLITRYFVPVVTLIAIVTWIIWMGLGLGGVLPNDYYDLKLGGWPVWSLEFAIATFVVACPCGIGLAAPTALLVGSGLAAKFGILARGGGEAFQEMAQLDLLVFDKTGTLTLGNNPQVTDTKIITSTGLDEQGILDIACALENTSSHPLALAIRDYCRSRSATGAQGRDFEEVPGKGLKASFDTPQGHVVAVIGNEAWMREHNAEPDAGMYALLHCWKAGGKSVALLAVSTNQEGTQSQLVAAFAVMDPPRPESRAVVQKLQASGVQTWMISGDNKTTATAVAASVGIPPSNVMAEVLPHEKAEAVRRLQLEGPKKKSLFASKVNQRCIVGMVGDGVNDAPALTVADVGIAIGSGSDVAISSASFILLSSNLQGLLTLSDLSRRVFHRVIFNFFWACVYNMAAIPIAAGVIYPSHRIRLDPAWAALAMALSSVSVVCSSLLLKLYRAPKV